MTLQTLEHTSIDEITDVFNRSFADYLVPFKLTKEQLATKMQVENIHLKYSAGAFESDKLVGFILHGIHPSPKVAYNAGTGVIPEMRGQRLTQQMYAFILPLLRQEQFAKIQLEVISENTKAYKSYEAIGFKKVRELTCFKGNIAPSNISNPFKFKALSNKHWAILDTFWDWQPTWQNAMPAIENNKDNIQTIGLFAQDELWAYAVFNPTSKRIHQFGVHKNHRNQGIGRLLFSAVSKILQSDCSLINIDSSSASTISFLTHIGLKIFIKQYEMELNLDTN
ncbi:GNAT family N-acetyltransferase [Runella sp.]|uniref:GNAT family N-acetyltransferase n=1 Tax=Runella sp. TaxID=1960881 RepID=UPI003D135ABA